MKNFVKRCLILLVVLFVIVGISAFLFVGVTYYKYTKLPLSNDVLSGACISANIYDDQNTLLCSQNLNGTNYIELEKLPNHVKDAFISIEDKKFYSHHGVNYKRIAVAMAKNVASGKFKEGASTITQQLIKNTHLSSEKTIKRKLKEIALAKKVEKEYSKDKILEFYLNAIYFGNNTYGINEASEFYFSKPANLLNLQESALLAGMIKSPKNYDPITNENSAKKRRDLVLYEMSKDEKISQNDYFLAKNSKISLNLDEKNENFENSYEYSALDEASKILKLSHRQIALSGYKIYTFKNAEKSKRLDEALENIDFKTNDHAGIVIDNKANKIVAFKGCSAYRILTAKRSPASCLKPLFVYAPAINEDLISPATMLQDERLDLGNYKPENVDKKYHGYVSVRESISKSYNIPAIKVLSYVGIDKAKNYASKLGITFDENDVGYSLALGGMTYGVNLLELTNAYTTFANHGEFQKPSFISHIADSNGTLVYVRDENKTRVFREDTAYLITDMLKTCAKSGTAKKLGTIDNEIASKTGTNGSDGKTLDAYNIAYTQDETIGVWCGNLDNTPIDIVGGNAPTKVSALYFSGAKKAEFEAPTSVVLKEIDLCELESSHRVTLANKYTPERFKKAELFSRFNLPEEVSENFAKKPEIDANLKMEDDIITISIKADKICRYKIYHTSVKETNLLDEIDEKSGKCDVCFENVSYEKIIIKASYISGSKYPESEKTFTLYKKAENKKP